MKKILLVTAMSLFFVGCAQPQNQRPTVIIKKDKSKRGYKKGYNRGYDKGYSKAKRRYKRRYRRYLVEPTLNEESMEYFLEDSREL